MAALRWHILIVHSIIVGGGMSAFAKLSNLRSAGKKPSVEISVDAKASDGVDAAVNKKRAEKHDVQRIEKQNVQRAEKQLQERVEEQIQEQNEMKGQDSSSEDSMTTDSSISSSSRYLDPLHIWLHQLTGY